MRISIVVPIYNVEKYLPECVDSLLSQTYHNIEIILVDDGSPDTCPTICDEYAQKDNRIEVIHKKNEGVAFARMSGLIHASGEYVMFVDGDDWLEKTAVERCIHCIENNDDIDLVIFQYIKETDRRSIPIKVMNKSEVGRGAKYIHRRIFGQISSELRYPGNLNNLGVCWGKLYKREIALQGKSFDLKKIGSAEDILFNMYALQHCKHIELLDEHLYHYRKRGDSLSDRCRPELPRMWKNLFDEMGRVILTFELGYEYKHALYNRIALSILGMGLNELSNQEHSIRQHIKVIKKYINSKRYQKAARQIEVKYLPIPWKVLIFCAKYRLSVMTCFVLYGIRMIVKIR